MILQYKCDLRWHDDGRLTDRTLTPNRATAEVAYRALLAREDLIGQPCAARLVTPQARHAVYFSRFDRDIGQGRIHPDAPLNLDRTDDGTREASAWQPPDIDLAAIDWSDLASALKSWRTALGLTQAAAAERLTVRLCTYQSWEQGRYLPEQPGLVRLACASINTKKRVKK